MERASRRRKGRIRDELIVGMAAVVVLCAAVTYATVLSATRKGFADLVERNDVEIASSYAEALAASYAENGSWSGAGAAVAGHRLAAIREPRQEGGRHSKDDVPIIVTDQRGEVVYSGIEEAPGADGRRPPARFPVGLGAEIRSDGEIVGYAFFKSMIQPAYSTQEQAYLSSLARSLAVSVGAGLALAIALGAALAGRFARRVSSLENAVRALARGDLGARVDERGGDELGALAASFNLMGDRLKAAETARQNLLADLAHELRTPVAIIQANLEMIIDGAYSADEARIRSLHDETLILADLVGSLRAISDLETGASPAAPSPISLPAALAESCDHYRPLFDRKGVALIVSEPAGFRPIANVDPDRLRQTLRNILANALKHAPPASTVVAGYEEADGEAPHGRVGRMVIADQGPGVPEADLGRIFERFYRVDGSRSRDSGGRGLGLAICRQFIEASGGSIRAKNRSPNGLEVSVELPLIE